MRNLLRPALPLFGLFLLALPAGAGEVVVGGEVVLRLDSPERVAEVSRRIRELLDSGAEADTIRSGLLGRNHVVYWGDQVIVVVDRALARANHSSPESLSVLWAANLRRAVQTGRLRVRPRRLEMPVGESRILTLAGPARGPVEVREATGRVEVRADTEADRLEVRARASGKTKLEILRDGARAVVWIHVKDWAGDPPEQYRVEVSGDPAPGPLVMEATLVAARTQTRVRPGCRLVLPRPDLELPSVPPRQSIRFLLPIRIEGGEDYFPVDRTVPVGVRNLPLEPVEPNLLLVSNRPEEVDADGVLLDYTFTRSEPSRLMYSHFNASKGRRDLWVELNNPDRKAVRLFLAHSFAGPSRNEVQTGHAAARRFLNLRAARAGYIVAIPPRSSLNLADHSMGPGELVSGFATLRILAGERLRLRVLTATPEARRAGRELPPLGAPFNPFKIHPHGVFAQPFFEEEVEYRVGGEPRELLYGRGPWLIDFNTGLPNTGNYGVLYLYDLYLSNPDSEPRQVGIYFSPLKGPAAGSFLVNGRLRQVAFRRPGKPTLVEAVELQPGERRRVRLVTLPEASSHYPARLEIQEVVDSAALEEEQ